MGTSKKEIREWLQEAKEKKATHLIVVCDTFDYEDYPVFVSVGQDPKLVAQHYGKEMQRVMEVYALHLDWESQLKEHRSFHFEPPQ